jgi:hypothetical protein
VLGVNGLIYGPYYKYEDEPETVELMFENMELWGGPRRNGFGLYAAVKAHSRPLGVRGWVQFTTEVAPDPPSCAPGGQVQWSGNRQGIRTCHVGDKEWFKIKFLTIEHCTD